MNIVDISTGKEYLEEILLVEKEDFKSYKEDRYFFDWRIEKNQEVYKLQIMGSSDVLGLISIERYPEEWRIHIRLLTVSKENKGKGKKYDRITGNLITHVAKTAIVAYGELACVSLKPKTQIAQHYIEKYKMNITGMTLSLEVPELIDLINLYDHD
ncbi:MAG: N-acetyltransferase [Bacteroidetes bacterium]|nr:N-acetyltransferase [Bacteroidota bacterium]